MQMNRISSPIHYHVYEHGDIKYSLIVALRKDS